MPRARGDSRACRSIELPTRQVSVGRGGVQLTRKEFDLLALLAQRPGVVFRREQIISEVWRTSWEGTGRTLEVHVASLRVQAAPARPDRDRARRRLPARRAGRAEARHLPCAPRLLPLLIVLMAAVLLALGFPLALSLAGPSSRRWSSTGIDDTARFAALAQFVTDRYRRRGRAARRTLQNELDRYETVYGIRAGVFYRDGPAMAAAPRSWTAARRGRGPRRPSRRRLPAAAAATPRRSGPGSTADWSSLRPWSGTGTWSRWSSPTRRPARCVRGSCAAGC